MDGKVALVTGAGHGQGRSHAVRLAQEGADIIAVDICRNIDTVKYDLATIEELEETAQMVEQHDRRVVFRRADVRDKAELSAAVTAGVEELGKLDTVVANAGIWSQGPILDVSEETYHDIIDVLQHGVFYTCQVTIPHLIEAGGGSIVITSSTAGAMGFPYLSPYTMGKHAVVGLMKSLAGELGEQMIRVNCVMPTSTLTPMINNQNLWEEFSPEVSDPQLEDFGKLLQSWHMLPVPYNDPVDISNAVLFLASDEARHVTGIQLPVDAGFLEKI